MKFHEWIIPLLVFSAFLTLGRWTGRQIEATYQSISNQRLEARLAAKTQFDLPQFSEDSFAPAAPVAERDANMKPDSPAYGLETGSDLPLPAQEATPTHTQKNILLIGVDDLTAGQPKLRGVWLALYLLDQPRVTLIPIYPSVVSLEGNPYFFADQDLADDFKLSPGGEPDPDFLKLLEAQDLWWSNYAVLDGKAIAGFLQFIGESNPGEKPVEVAIPEDPATNPNEALLYQINILQTGCHASKLEYTPRQIAEFIASMKGHMATDISAAQIAGDLKSMNLFGGSLMCEFPSLVFAHQT